jgi:hypothetical protein
MVASRDPVLTDTDGGLRTYPVQHPAEPKRLYSLSH